MIPFPVSPAPGPVPGGAPALSRVTPPGTPSDDKLLADVAQQLRRLAAAPEGRGSECPFRGGLKSSQFMGLQAVRRLQAILRRRRSEVPLNGHGSEARKIGAVALTSLADDLEAGGAAQAGVDLLTSYRPEAALPDVPDPRAESKVRRIERTRDISVFLPLLFTWLQLWEVLHDGSGTGSLMQRWQQGDGPALSLANSALVTALLVLVMIYFTWRLPVERERAHRAASREGDREVLAAHLVLANVILARRSGSAEAVGAGRLSPRDMVKLATAVQAASGQFETAVQGISEEITKAMEAAPGSALLGAIQRWTTTAEALTGAVGALAGPAEAMREFAELRSELVESERRLQAGLTALLARLDRAFEAAQAQGEATAAVGAAVGELDRGLQSFGRRMADIDDAFRVIRRILDEVARRAGLDVEARAALRDDLPGRYERPARGGEDEWDR